MDDGRNARGHATGFVRQHDRMAKSMPTLAVGEVVHIKGVAFKVEWMRKRGLKLMMQPRDFSEPES